MSNILGVPLILPHGSQTSIVNGDNPQQKVNNDITQQNVTETKYTS